VSGDPRIDHVVVLMLENRSFDHMLGYLYPDKTQDQFHGLQRGRAYSNPRVPGNPAAGSVPVSRGKPWVTSPDSGHEFRDATLQLYGTEAGNFTADPTMDGFVAAYRRTQEKAAAAEEARLEPLQRDAYGPPSFDPPADTTGAAIMTCFDTGALPSLHSLAREFAVCDAWFSSLPGPTWPNRFFVHCASSDGRVNMTREDFSHPYRMDTIFNRLEAAGEPWAIYYHDVPQSLMLRKLRDHPQNFKLIYDFKDDVLNGTLPSYSFIEPRYFDFIWKKANDQHPPHDVRYGDVLIGRIYETLRSNDEVWKKTMLVILYDEHGGFYDHVPPGVAPAPDATDPLEFAFKRYGVRVPAVVVSPYVERGDVIHDVFDHSSIPATLKELFGLPQPLTRRDGGANTLSRALKLQTPRDIPWTSIPRTLDTRPAWDAVEFAESANMTTREINGALRNDGLSREPLSEFQRSLLENISTVTGASHADIATEGEAALAVRNVMQWVARGKVVKDEPSGGAG
jgi:phospholipase C